MRQKCSLVLSNGTRFEGELIGAPVSASGQLVFTTGMVGYSEALTDPSYFGQILIFSYPLIGNYGIPRLPDGLSLPIPSGFESNKVHASAVIVTVDSQEAFHWRSYHSLEQWLANQGVPGIVGLDTRHIVHMVRNSKNLLARVVPEHPSGKRDMGSSVQDASQESFFDPGAQPILQEVAVHQSTRITNGSPRIAIVDCGVKWNIIRQLVELNCGVELIPWNSDLSKVECDGWLISNGPGDPQQSGNLTQQIRKLISGTKPVLGICLGHQLLALAAGLTTERMNYGHRSHNQPVYLVGTRRGFITSQNHGYVVNDASVPADWEVWFRNVNDQTIEGIKHKQKPFRSVQFHPEAAGGPRDTGWIIKDFVDEVAKACR
jgi:carbamoyl-phosphate synthase small subunit